MSFIHYAAERGDIEMTDLLLYFGANIDALANNSNLHHSKLPFTTGILL